MAIINLISAGTPYAAIINSSGQWYNGSAFENYNAANWLTYKVTATRYGASNVWNITFPSLSAGNYDIIQFLQSGGSAAQTDSCEGSVAYYWNATNLLTTTQIVGIDTTPKNDISDSVLLRDVSNTENTAGEHTLTGIILMNTECAIAGTTMTVKKTDGTTNFVTKTIGTTAGAAPIRSIS